MRTVSFVLPTKNEAHSISEVITHIRQEADRCNLTIDQIVVADDSSDTTPLLAKELGATVVNCGNNGLGAAMMKGLKQACCGNSSFIVSIDADGQALVSELEQFIQPLQEKQADLVIGSRFLQPNLVKYQYPKVNRFGVSILAHILKWSTGLPITDSHGGFRAMTVDVAKSLSILGRHTYVQETIMDASRKGYRIIEIPSQWLPREEGSSRVVRSIFRYVYKTLPVLLIRTGWHIYLILSLSLISFAIFLGSSAIPSNPINFLQLSFVLATVAILFAIHRQYRMWKI